ncbi:MAG TPA: hypothetical protein DIC64_00040 [Alphaproteobacteria bacterium]|nr:hypothetical protein [Alphaproteobacteria bacterium]
MAQYQPTVYEKIVQDFLDGKDLKFENYQAELLARGFGEKRYFDAYIKDMQYIKTLMDSPDFNLRKAADIAKQHHPSKDEDVLRFALTDEEKKIVLQAEELGSVKCGKNIFYDGYDRPIVCADAKHLPENTDAFVIFSGHPGAAEPAIEAWLNDYQRTGKPKKFVFLGLYDNQGNTDFSQEGLEFNTGSEVEMYMRYCRAVGISEDLLKECLMTPTDISTEDNTKLLAEIRKKYFKDQKNASFVMFGYAAYQKRIASEFAFAFNQMEKNGEMDIEINGKKKTLFTNFVMPDVARKKDEKNRYLSYDNLDGIAQDIIIGNCLAHPYRTYAGGRFDSKLGAYPDEFKPLLPISLVYSYPNVANELAGTRTDVATMLKLLRAIQHDVYEFENAKKVDRTIKYNVAMLRKRLVLNGLLSADILFHGNTYNKEDALSRIKKYFTHSDKRYEEAAKLLLGSEKVSPRKLGPVAQYLKKFWERGGNFS